MSARSVEVGTIRQHCKTLRMPTVASQFQKLAEQARRDKQSHVRYLDVLLSAEVEEREHRAVQRRLKEAQLPRTKTVDEFDFSQSPKVSARRIKELAEGHYIDRAQPVIFLGDAGTGKTHLASALCVAACQQRRRIRFTTASRLVNELVEARQEHELSRIIRRYAALVHNSDRGRELAWPRLPSSDHLAIRHPERRHGVQNLAPDPCLDSLCRQPSRSHR